MPEVVESVTAAEVVRTVFLGLPVRCCLAASLHRYGVIRLQPLSLHHVHFCFKIFSCHSSRAALKSARWKKPTRWHTVSSPDIFIKTKSKTEKALSSCNYLRARHPTGEHPQIHWYLAFPSCELAAHGKHGKHYANQGIDQ